MASLSRKTLHNYSASSNTAGKKQTKTKNPPQWPCQVFGIAH